MTKKSKGKLTQEQKAVANMVIMGLTNKEIARQLCYSEGNIKNLLQKLFKYYGVDNRVKFTREYMLDSMNS